MKKLMVKSLKFLGIQIIIYCNIFCFCRQALKRNSGECDLQKCATGLLEMSNIHLNSNDGSSLESDSPPSGLQLELSYHNFYSNGTKVKYVHDWQCTGSCMKAYIYM